MTRRIALATGLVAAVLVLALGIPMILLFHDSETTNLRLGMERDAVVLADDLAVLPPADWPRRLTAYGVATGARLTVVDRNQILLFDSEGRPAGQPFVRPETTEALTGRIASGVRDSATLGEPLTYTAVPIRQGSTIIGALRVSMPDSSVDAKVTNLVLLLVAALVLVLVLAVAAAWAVGRLLSRPLRKLAEGASRVGADPRSRVGAVGGPEEIREVAVALDDTAAKLSDSLERSRAVAEEASHHLRTPLAALRLRLEAIADTAEGPASADAEAAMVEVDRLSRRIDQILVMAAREGEPDPGPVAVADVVADRVSDWAGAVPPGVDLRCSTVPCSAQCSADQVERTLDELVGNALAYARTSVAVTVEPEEGMVVLTVADDGPGVPAEEHEDVFARFIRGSGAVPGGSGLGLAMVREAARSVGGDALVVPSSGMTVEVRWPQSEDRSPTG